MLIAVVTHHEVKEVCLLVAKFSLWGTRPEVEPDWLEINEFDEDELDESSRWYIGMDTTGLVDITVYPRVGMVLEYSSEGELTVSLGTEVIKTRVNLKNELDIHACNDQCYGTVPPDSRIEVVHYGSITTILEWK